MPEIVIYLILITALIALTISSLLIKNNIVAKSALHIAAAVFAAFVGYFLWRENLPYLSDKILYAAGFFVVYAIILASILMPLRFLTNIPSFIFRKLLHFSCFAVVIPVSIICGDGLSSALVIGTFMIMIINALGLFEPYKWYGKLFVEKNPNEVKVSFITFFALYAALSILANFLHAEYLPIIAILAWGPGDAAAALVGIPFGKHKWTLKFVDSNKSIEGTIANAVTTFIASIISLMILCPIAWYFSVMISIALALICPMVELISKKGIDTLTVPLSAFIILLLTII